MPSTANAFEDADIESAVVVIGMTGYTAITEPDSNHRADAVAEMFGWGDRSRGGRPSRHTSGAASAATPEPVIKSAWIRFVRCTLRQPLARQPH